MITFILAVRTIEKMYSIVIIGGGIVGFATALRLKESNPKLKIAVVEKEKTIASHQTGHNSGVIHSGLYYRPGSEKARNCIEGYHQLLDFCDQEEIPHEICGKLVVATGQEQVGALDDLQKRGQQNGLTGIRRLTNQDQLKEYEPHVAGIEGLYVPQTGIIDYGVVTSKYAEKFQHFGGEVFTDHTVKDIKAVKKGLKMVVTSNNVFPTRSIVICAGLQSDIISKVAGLETNYRIIPFRGEYFELKPNVQHLVKNLIYPVPDPNFPFLGVHFTRMISGGVEAGPNAVLAYRREGYRKADFHLGELLGSIGYKGFRKVMAKYWKTGIGEFYRSYSKSAFTRALQKLIPEIRKSDLLPGHAGVRAQACDRDGGLLDDFLFVEDGTILNVGNAPSPAATSSLSIGKTIAWKLLKKLG